MTLNELIEELLELRDSEDCGESEVMAAVQPNYPLAAEVDAITFDCASKGHSPVVWIATGAAPHGRNPYAPKHAWDGGAVYADDIKES